MFVAVAIGFPVLLLLAVLGMERVEHSLDHRGGRPSDAAPTTGEPEPSP